MSRPVPRRPLLAGICVAAAVLGLSGGAARAQFGFGYGYGYGSIFNGGGAASDRAMHSYLNQRAMIQASAATANLAGARGGYGGADNAYYNHVRDASIPRYDISTRRETTAGVPVQPPSIVANRPSKIPLARFFDASGVLAWVEGSPDEGPFGSLRGTASESASEVHRQVEAQGFAPVALVTDSRAKLLSYGRPALAQLQKSAPEAVTDRFHRFLLALYNALGEAASPPAS